MHRNISSWFFAHFCFAFVVESAKPQHDTFRKSDVCPNATKYLFFLNFLLTRMSNVGAPPPTCPKPPKPK